MGIYCTGHLHSPREAGRQPSVSRWGKAEPRDTFTSGSEVWYRDVKKGRQAEVPPHLAQARCGGRAHHSSPHIRTVSWSPQTKMFIESRGLVRSWGLEGRPQVAGGVAVGPPLLPVACWDLGCWSQLRGPPSHLDTISQSWKESQGGRDVKDAGRGSRKVKRGFWRKEDSTGHREIRACRAEEQAGRQILEQCGRQWNRKEGWRRAGQAPPSPPLPSSNIQILDPGPRH